jgi:hypothetical protein
MGTPQLVVKGWLDHTGEYKTPIFKGKYGDNFL